MNKRNLPMALQTSPDHTAHATIGDTTYVLTAIESHGERSVELTLIATSKELGRVTIPAGTYHTPQDVLSAYPELDTVGNWERGWPQGK